VTTALIIEPLSPADDRNAFACGVTVLDRYFREQASQDAKRRLGNCFVAKDRETGAIAGYYTLAATSIPFVDLHEDDARRLPRYPLLPATLIGRLAVDTRYQGRGIGSALLAEAFHQVVRAAPASFALVVDAKDDAAAAFYRRYGFRLFGSRPLSLYLPMSTALKLFGDA
jgi:ribosomal protein S18 acetylase RimI-like enzyme